MFHLRAWIFLGLFLAFNTNAYAENSGIYVGGIVGTSFRPDTNLTGSTLGGEKMEFDPGFTFGGFVGYDFGSNLRLETEISYRENSIRTGGGGDPQVGTSVMMFNAFYDFYPFKDDFEIYLGGGIGPAAVQLETISLGRTMNERETVFAFQVEAGIGYNITPLATFSIGYRFFDSTDPEFELSDGTLVKMGIQNHELILKMRYLFNL